jgi:glycine cleavage system H protein
VETDMTTPPHQPAHTDDSPPSSAAPPQRAEFAVSPGRGLVPAVYVQRSPGRTRPPGLAARVLRRWRRRLSIGATMSDIPLDRGYSRDHLWAASGDTPGLVRVGVTDFAQESLGDVIGVTLPRLGEAISAGKACGDVESTKSVSDLVSPVTGTVRACNDGLAGAPELINADPYGDGWLFEVECDPATIRDQLAALLAAAAYRELVGA